MTRFPIDCIGVCELCVQRVGAFGVGGGVVGVVGECARAFVGIGVSFGVVTRVAFVGECVAEHVQLGVVGAFVGGGVGGGVKCFHLMAQAIISVSEFVGAVCVVGVCGVLAQVIHVQRVGVFVCMSVGVLVPVGVGEFGEFVVVPMSVYVKVCQSGGVGVTMRVGVFSSCVWEFKSVSPNVVVNMEKVRVRVRVFHRSLFRVCARRRYAVCACAILPALRRVQRVRRVYRQRVRRLCRRYRRRVLEYSPMVAAKESFPLCSPVCVRLCLRLRCQMVHLRV